MRHCVAGSVWGIAAALLVFAAPVEAGAPLLSFPVACTIGVSCQVQNYPDEDSGPGARDFACGAVSYEGHKGTDIRLRDVAAMQAGVNVLAAADGVVKGVRDGMDDVSVRVSGAGPVSGRECGNGVVIEHGDGWVTQYCHMRKGSIAVAAGARISRGSVVGKVGLSGFTEFAHLHFEVRQGKSIIDPFTGGILGAQPASQCGASRAMLWDGETSTVLRYRPAAFLSGGFAAGPVSLEAVEVAPPVAPGVQSPALVAYVRVVGVRSGDVETLSVTGPDGTSFISKGPEPIAKAKVQWLSFAGRKRTASAWARGLYKGQYRLVRDGKVVVDEAFTTLVK